MSNRLFAFQKIETGHVLLQGLDTKAVSVEGCVLFDWCGRLLSFSPVLRRAEAVPVRLVLSVQLVAERED